MSMHESIEKCMECKQELLVHVYGFSNPMGILCPKCLVEWRSKQSNRDVKKE